jgi:hypothetical protein
MSPFCAILSAGVLPCTRNSRLIHSRRQSERCPRVVMASMLPKRLRYVLPTFMLIDNIGLQVDMVEMRVEAVVLQVLG